MGAIAAVLALVLAACGGSSDEPEARSGPPGACKKPPVTMQVQAGGDQVAGSEQFKVTDAVTRRVAIVPKAKTGTPAELAAAKKKAASTSLAYYSTYLANFPIERTALSGAGTGDVTPPEGKTLGTVTFVPTTKDGFEEGDVAKAVPFLYETTSTLTPLVAVVRQGPDGTGQGFTEVKGQVRILYLTAKTICVGIDLTLLDGEEPIYMVKGSVLTPIVEADPSFFIS